MTQPYRTFGPSSREAPNPRSRKAILCAGLGLGAILAAGFAYARFRDFVSVQEFSIDVAHASHLDSATTERVSWWSPPVTSARGVVYGLVRADANTNQLVAITENTGQFLWRIAVPRDLALATYTRNVGWSRPATEPNVREVAPVAPFGAANGSSVLFVFDHEWVVADAASGTVLGTGTLPKAVPPFDGLRGAFPQDDGFWVGVQDGRNGGIRIDARGTSTLERNERPSDCRDPVLFQGQFGFRWSPNAQLRQTKAPPASCMRTRKNASAPTNTCMSFLGETPSGKRLGMAYEEVHYGEGSGALAFRLRGVSDTVPSAYAVESGWGGALFFTMALFQSTTRVHEPPKTSFDPRTTTTDSSYVEAIVATSAEGRPLWVVSPGSSRYLYDTSILVVSHAESQEALLYLYKPGSLTALDQRSGAVRFRFAPQ